jgi:hypothetical protein
MRKVSSAEKRPKLRHFFISCGSAKNYLPQEKSRNCVTFCTFAEDTPYFSERVAKKIEKSPCKPLCKPPFLVLFCYFYRFLVGVLPQNPKKARNCVVFAAEDIKKHLPQNASQKPEKSPKLREKMIAEDMQRVSSALSSATSADFSRKFKRVVNYRSNTTTL